MKQYLRLTIRALQVPNGRWRRFIHLLTRWPLTRPFPA